MQDLIDRFLQGDRRALSRLITQVENRTQLGAEAVRRSFDRTGSAHIVGITGPPGAGKSTLVNALIREFRSQGKSVAVLAIDPSSILTGGATLGDRIRMNENYADPSVYIRSMATRGQMGGLALAVTGAAHLLDAYGFEIVLIETVGVGQDEVDIAEMADTTLVLQVPGLGDSIQTIKAGILEVADILVVNKSDRPDARQLVRDLRNMLLLSEATARSIPIVETTATEGEGLPRLAKTIEEHRDHLIAVDERKARASRRLLREVKLLAREEIDRSLNEELASPRFGRYRDELGRRSVDPGTVAHRLIETLRDENRDVVAPERSRTD